MTKIEIPDVKADVFRGFLCLFIFLIINFVLVLLEFLYCGDVRLTTNLALEVFLRADKYSVRDLKKKCEEFLVEHLTVDNFVKITCDLEETMSNFLKNALVEFVSKNLTNKKVRDEIFNLPKAILGEIIIQPYKRQAL
jgi:hypothetical protein